MSEEGRTLHVGYLSRVEGEGALHLAWKGEELVDLQLRIFEPPRFFEGLLRGRMAIEAPDLTARICGICPVAYQTSACVAVEDAFGVVLPPHLSTLRRALYCGEWIESHVLHMLMLHTPDFLGVPDAMAVARLHRDAVQAGLRVKKAGNALVAALGGREIHPINVKVGGFWRLPRRDELDRVREQLAAARADALAMVRWMATFDFPDLERDATFVALRPADTYPFFEGPLASTGGLAIDVHQWSDHFAEEHVERSTALHCRLHGQAYLTGPLARFALNADRLPDELRTLAEELGLEGRVTNPFRSILVRGVEVLYAMDEACRLLDRFPVHLEPSVPVTPRAGVGWGASEAPRGTLVHRYEIDAEGRILDAVIVPPTSQNQLAIEADLRALAPELRTLDEASARHRAEMAIRNHDPCISCSTHFLTLERRIDPA